MAIDSQGALPEARGYVMHTLAPAIGFSVSTSLTRIDTGL